MAHLNEESNLSTTAEISTQLTDLEECNKERLHLIASIQSHGCLLLFSPNDQRVQMASQNVQDIIKLTHQQVLGARLEHLFPPALVEQILDVTAAHPWNGQNGRSLEFIQGESVWECYVFHSEGLFGLEIEIYSVLAGPTGVEKRESSQRVSEFITQLSGPKNIEELAASMSRAIRQITGMDRVMIYRFIPGSWHGEVIAEDRKASAHSFLGHRFPSSDIPKPARDLYLRNHVRFISGSSVKPSLLEPVENPLTQKVVDLSDSRIRAVSPIHLEYLRNMGVKSSLSFALTENGRLWGLIACHHLTDFNFYNYQRRACEMIAHAFSAHGPMLEILNSYRARVSFDTKLKKFLETIRGAEDPIVPLFRQHQIINEIFDVVGMAYLTLDRVDAVGITPLSEDLKKLAHELRDKMIGDGRQYLAIEQLNEVLPGFTGPRRLIGGLLAVLFPKTPGGILIFFRPEIVKTIIWGGDPRKQLDKKNFKGQLNPRASFVAWEEVVRDQCKPWSSYEIDGALFLRDFGF